jgi:hypothetical protein
VTRIERHMLSTGDLAFGGYPDIDDLYQRQAREPDRGKREGLLHAIQQIAHAVLGPLRGRAAHAVIAGVSPPARWRWPR